MDAFLARAEVIAEKLLEHLGQKSNRLAFIVNALLKEMTAGELTRCYEKLFRPFGLYKSTHPFEWINRSISQSEISLAGTSEAANIITEIKRSDGKLTLGSKVVNCNRLCFEYEFNTSQRNKDTRFDASQMGPFMALAKKTYNEIAGDLEGVIDAV
jgi:hypothetical protein